MPQMAPMDWTMLNFYFFMIFIFLMIFLNFFSKKFYFTQNKSKYKYSFKMKW